MLRRRFHLLFLGFFIALAGCASQNDSPSPSASPTPSASPAARNTTAAKTATASPRDDLGREIKLDGVPRRIITIGPGATETVFALGLGSRLVGRDSAPGYPDKAMERVAVVADFNGPAFESVLAARPDLIIVQGETYGSARIETWQKKCGAPVANLAATSVAGVAQDIRKIGAWLGAREKAETIAKRLENVPRIAVAGKPPQAVFELGRAPLWVAGRNTLIDDVMKRAGIANAASDVDGYMVYNLENLATKNPDFYIVTDKESNRARIMKSLRATNGVRDLKCIKAARVLIVDPDLVLRPGPRLGDGIARLRSQMLVMKSKAPA